jgi:hypothetical protein
MITMLATAAVLTLPIHAQQRPSAHHTKIFTAPDGGFQFSHSNGFSSVPAREDRALYPILHSSL